MRMLKPLSPNREETTTEVGRVDINVNQLLKSDSSQSLVSNPRALMQGPFHKIQGIRHGQKREERLHKIEKEADLMIRQIESENNQRPFLSLATESFREESRSRNSTKPPLSIAISEMPD